MALKRLAKASETALSLGVVVEFRLGHRWHHAHPQDGVQLSGVGRLQPRDGEHPGREAGPAVAEEGAAAVGVLYHDLDALRTCHLDLEASKEL